MGYMGASELSLRLRDTFDSMDSLERMRGHFLNWYDTLDTRGTPAACRAKIVVLGAFAFGVGIAGAAEDAGTASQLATSARAIALGATAHADAARVVQAVQADYAVRAFAVGVVFAFLSDAAAVHALGAATIRVRLLAIALPVRAIGGKAQELRRFWVGRAREIDAAVRGRVTGLSQAAWFAAVAATIDIGLVEVLRFVRAGAGDADTS
jgi:hypothetical protein